MKKKTNVIKERYKEQIGEKDHRRREHKDFITRLFLRTKEKEDEKKESVNT